MCLPEGPWLSDHVILAGGEECWFAWFGESVQCKMILSDCSSSTCYFKAKK